MQNQPFKPWSKGYSTGITNSDAVMTAEGMPICRMVEPVVPNAIDLILAAPMMHKALFDLVQCLERVMNKGLFFAKPTPCAGDEKPILSQ